MLNRTENTTLQPTLSIYLGGSGIAVGQSLLTMLEAFTEDEKRLIEPYFIDSQAPTIRDHQRARHYCYQNLDQFFEPIFSEFAERRFPENLGENPVINSSEGCGITRIFGAASLVNCRDDFGNLVDDASARLRKHRRSSTDPLQVFLTASACGGTGAGMILDAAALTRHFFRERGENPRIFMFLIGPSVYLDDPQIPLRQDQRDRMRASTYALLKELHHFAKGNPFKSAYRMRDQTIDIGNLRDDDRLFEWVYYIDGRNDQGATRSLDEVSWTIAETQLHLAMTDVGRKVAESLPNQREERVREFAPEFIHADNKDRMSDDARRRLERASRRTFLASFAIRNVRFPLDEIKNAFRWKWVRQSFDVMLHGRSGTSAAQAIDEFDQLLGFADGAVQAEGLLSDLGLGRDQLLSRVRDDADPSRGIPEPPSVNASPDRVISAGGALIEAATTTVVEMKKDASAARATADSASASLLGDALPGWKRLWEEGLQKDGDISARLWDIAWDAASMRGLRYVDGLVTHTAQLLTDLATGTAKRPSIKSLEEAIENARGRLTGLMKKRNVEHGGLTAVAKRLIGKLQGKKQAYSAGLEQTARTMARDLITLRQQLIDQRALYIASALAPRAWLIAARELKRWRDEVLAPAIIATENAFTLAENEWKLADAGLVKRQGINARGFWTSHTTVQLADAPLLLDLEKAAAKVSVEDLVLAPLHTTGISRERHRLTSKTLAALNRETTVAIVHEHVTAATMAALEFLDNGWALPQVAARLQTAGKALDEGAEPLVSFARAAVGQQLQSYLLTPRKLLLPEPFGRSLGRMNRLVSADPLQMTVVSFVFGIPPNTLQSIGEMFTQYATHLGDQMRNKAYDRYPMHVFRDAAETFDEPHSPLEFQTNDEMVGSLVHVAKRVWDESGGIRLDIREWKEQSLQDDMNRLIELIEKLLLHFKRRPESADLIFSTGEFPDLARLYDSRRHRIVSPSKGAGNGTHP